jgi:hypothetical protein
MANVNHPGILEEAHVIIFGDREKTYGNPAKNLENIANLWEMYLRGKGIIDEDCDGLFAQDVALMMILLKTARLINTPDHRDSLVDICGYAALIERIKK